MSCTSFSRLLRFYPYPCSPRYQHLISRPEVGVTSSELGSRWGLVPNPHPYLVLGQLSAIQTYSLGTLDLIIDTKRTTTHSVSCSLNRPPESGLNHS